MSAEADRRLSAIDALAQYSASTSGTLTVIAALSSTSDAALAMNPNLPRPALHLVADRATESHVAQAVVRHPAATAADIVSWLKGWADRPAGQARLLWRSAFATVHASSVAAAMWQGNPRPWQLRELMNSPQVGEADRLRAAVEFLRHPNTRRAGQVTDGADIVALARRNPTYAPTLAHISSDHLLAGALTRPTTVSGRAATIAAAGDDEQDVVVNVLASSPTQEEVVQAVTRCREHWTTAANLAVDYAARANPSTARQVITHMLANRAFDPQARRRALLVLARHPDLGRQNTAEVVAGYCVDAASWNQVAQVAQAPTLVLACAEAPVDLSPWATLNLVDWFDDQGDPNNWRADNPGQLNRWAEHRRALLSMLVRGLDKRTRARFISYASADPLSRYNRTTSTTASSRPPVKAVAKHLARVGRARRARKGAVVALADVETVRVRALLHPLVSASPIVQQVAGEVLTAVCAGPSAGQGPVNVSGAALVVLAALSEGAVRGTVAELAEVLHASTAASLT